jgi:hypothetical protein
MTGDAHTTGYFDDFEGSTRALGSPSGEVRYVTHPAGRDTRVLGLSRDGRRITTQRLSGRFVVPVVAYDGTPAGLSADGRTLVLIRPRITFPQSTTNLAILDTRELRVRSYVRLRGDFSFDAISPKGDWIYLIQYTSAVDPTRYRVRALNAHTERLVAHDIVDPRDRAEAMRGNPIARATSLDGRWAYTLYDGNGHPFVHALDTTSQKARCIDVPASPANSDPWASRLQFTPDRTQLLLTSNDRTFAAIDIGTLTVRRPSPVRSLRPRVSQAQPGSLGGALSLVGIFAILAAGTLAARRRTSRRKQ